MARRDRVNLFSKVLATITPTSRSDQLYMEMDWSEIGGTNYSLESGYAAAIPGKQQWERRRAKMENWRDPVWEWWEGTGFSPEPDSSDGQPAGPP